MADLPEPESLASTEPPFLDLFMTVVRVADWSTIVRWYIDTLRLVPVLMDPQHEFAFLAAGQGRLGLQGVKGPREPTVPSKVRLVFQVARCGSRTSAIDRAGGRGRACRLTIARRVIARSAFTTPMAIA